MIGKIKKLFFNDLVKISSWIGVSTAIRIGSQFIISKILAIFIGPSGLALMGQLTNVVNVFQAAASGGITIGVTKYVAQFDDDKKQFLYVHTNTSAILFLAITSLIM